MVLPRARRGGQGDGVRPPRGGGAGALAPAEWQARRGPDSSLTCTPSLCPHTGRAAAAARVHGEGRGASAPGLGPQGQDRETNGVRQPELPLRANRKCFRCMGAAWALHGRCMGSASALHRLPACDAYAMAGAQEEEEKARKNTKNDYNGGLRGGLPHGFGTKIYTVTKSWQGRSTYGRVQACVLRSGQEGSSEWQHWVNEWQRWVTCISQQVGCGPLGLWRRTQYLGR